MTRTIPTPMILSSALLALSLVFAPLSAQAEQCADYYDAAGKAAIAKDIKAVTLLLDKAGSCCAVDIDTASAQRIIGDIKGIVALANSVAAKHSGERNDAGKTLAAALGCAGQPSIVAVDPTLYSTVLADSAVFAELARDENGGIGKKVQYARQFGNRPSNNQQPTVSIEQK